MPFRAKRQDNLKPTVDEEKDKEEKDKCVDQSGTVEELQKMIEELSKKNAEVTQQRDVLQDRYNLLNMDMDKSQRKQRNEFSQPFATKQHSKTIGTIAGDFARQTSQQCSGNLASTSTSSGNTLSQRSGESGGSGGGGGSGGSQGSGESGNTMLNLVSGEIQNSGGSGGSGGSGYEITQVSCESQSQGSGGSGGKEGSGIIYPSLLRDGPGDSIGSAQHGFECKPCAFYCFSNCGCRDSVACFYCHQYHDSKLKARKETWKKKKEMRAEARNGHQQRQAQSDRVADGNRQGIGGVRPQTLQTSANVQAWDKPETQGKHAKKKTSKHRSEVQTSPETCSSFNISSGSSGHDGYRRTWEASLSSLRFQEGSTDGNMSPLATHLATLGVKEGSYGGDMVPLAIHPDDLQCFSDEPPIEPGALLKQLANGALPTITTGVANDRIGFPITEPITVNSAGKLGGLYNDVRHFSAPPGLEKPLPNASENYVATASMPQRAPPGLFF